MLNTECYRSRPFMVGLFLLLLATSLGALEIHGEFQVGRAVEEPLAFTYLRLELPVSLVTLYGSWRTWSEVEIPEAYPFRDIYEIGVEVAWRDLFFDLNHFCNHGVFSDETGWRSQKWGEVITTVSAGVRW